MICCILISAVGVCNNTLCLNHFLSVNLLGNWEILRIVSAATISVSSVNKSIYKS